MIVGDAYVKIRPDGRGFSDEAERSLLGSMGSLAKKAAVVFGSAFVADQAVRGIAEAVGLASDLSESMSKAEVVFGSASAAVKEFAAAAPDALGQTEAQALEATGTLGNLLRAVGLSEEASADLSTSMVTLASDLASFNNTEASEALDALRAGLVGETEPLKRFGVNLNENLLKQKAWQLGLTDGSGVLSANAKAQAAYALIMEQTSLAQGDFARTSDGLANQQRILKANVDQAKAAFGAGLLPVLERLAPVAGDAVRSLAPFLEQLGAGLGNAVAGAVDGVTAAIDVVERFSAALSGVNVPASIAVELGKIFGWMEDSSQVDAMATVFERLSTAGVILTGALTSIAGEVTTLAPSMEDLTRIWTEQEDVLLPLTAGVVTFVAALGTLSQVSGVLSSLQTGFALLGPALSKALAPLLANPAGLIVAGIVALGAALFVAYQKIEPFRNAVDAVARVLRDVAVAAFDQVSEAVRNFGPTLAELGSMLSGVGETLRSFAGSAIDAVSPFVGWVQENVFPLFAAVADFADALGDRISDVAGIIASVVSTLAPIVRKAFEIWWKVVGPLVTGVLRQIWNTITTTAAVLTDVLGVAFDAVGLIVSTVFNGIKAVVESVLGTLTGVFTVFAGVLRGDFGKVWDGLQQIVRAPLEAILGFVQSTFGNVLDFLGTLPGRLLSIGSTLFGGLVDAIGITLGTVVGVVTGAFGGVLSFLAGLPGQIVTAAGDLFGFIGTQALNVVTAVGETLASLPGKVGELAGSLLTQGVELGKAVLNGIIAGLSGLADLAVGLVGDLTSAAKDIAGGIINALIDGLNSVFPDEIGRVEVAGYTVFPGLDLPDNPIPRVKLARGGRVRARAGGVAATLAEAGFDELVLSTNPAMRQRNAGLLAGTGMADPLVVNAMIARLEAIANRPRVGQLTLANPGPPVRHAMDFLSALDDAEWMESL